MHWVLWTLKCDKSEEDDFDSDQIKVDIDDEDVTFAEVFAELAETCTVTFVIFIGIIDPFFMEHYIRMANSFFRHGLSHRFKILFNN